MVDSMCRGGQKSLACAQPAITKADTETAAGISFSKHFSFLCKFIVSAVISRLRAQRRLRRPDFLEFKKTYQWQLVAIVLVRVYLTHPFSVPRDQSTFHSYPDYPQVLSETTVRRCSCAATTQCCARQGSPSPTTLLLFFNPLFLAQCRNFNMTSGKYKVCTVLSFFHSMSTNCYITLFRTDLSRCTHFQHETILRRIRTSTIGLLKRRATLSRTTSQLHV
jgi:hypothetical protein